MALFEAPCDVERVENRFAKASIVELDSSNKEWFVSGERFALISFFILAQLIIINRLKFGRGASILMSSSRCDSLNSVQYVPQASSYEGGASLSKAGIWNLSKKSDLKNLVGYASQFNSPKKAVAAQKLMRALGEMPQGYAEHWQLREARGLLLDAMKNRGTDDEGLEAGRSVLHRKQEAGVLSDSDFEDFIKAACRYSATEFISNDIQRKECFKTLLVQLDNATSWIARRELRALIAERLADSYSATRRGKLKLGVSGGVNGGQVGLAVSKAKVLQPFLDGNVCLTDQVLVEGKLTLLGLFKGRATGVVQFSGHTFHTIAQLSNYLVDRPDELRMFAPALYSQFKGGRGADSGRSVVNYRNALLERDRSAAALETLAIARGASGVAGLLLPKARQEHGVETVDISRGINSAELGLGIDAGVLSLNASAGYGKHLQRNYQYERLDSAFNNILALSERMREGDLAIAALRRDGVRDDSSGVLQVAMEQQERDRIQIDKLLKELLGSEYKDCARIFQLAETVAPEQLFTYLNDKKLKQIRDSLTEYQQALLCYGSARNPQTFGLFNWPVWHMLPDEKKEAYRTMRRIEKQLGAADRVEVMRTLSIKYAKYRYVAQYLLNEMTIDIPQYVQLKTDLEEKAAGFFKEGLINARFSVESPLSPKKNDSKQSGHRHPSRCVSFLPAPRHFGGKQAHWP